MTEAQRHEELAEAAYAEMYDATRGMAKTHFEDACAHFAHAIAAARDAGRGQDAARLEQRLEHVRTVYDHQFRGV